MENETFYQQVKEVLQKEGFLVEKKPLPLDPMATDPADQRLTEGLLVTKDGAPANCTFSVFINILRNTARLRIITSFDDLQPDQERFSSPSSILSYPTYKVGAFFNKYLPATIRGNLEEPEVPRKKKDKINVIYSYIIDMSLLEKDDQILTHVATDFVAFVYGFMGFHHSYWRPRLIEDFSQHYPPRNEYPNIDENTI